MEIDFLSYKKYNYIQEVSAGMTKMGRPKSDQSKKKVLSVRVADSLYQRVCAYAEQKKLTVTEIVLEGLEKLLSEPEKK